MYSEGWRIQYFEVEADLEQSAVVEWAVVEQAVVEQVVERTVVEWTVVELAIYFVEQAVEQN